MERKMDTNTNFSNSNIQIDAGIQLAVNYHQEIIGQLPNPTVMSHLTTMDNFCWFKSITKRRLYSDFLADRGSFANEQ